MSSVFPSAAAVPASCPPPVTLDQLASGQRARVRGLSVPPQQAEWARQLEDLGFVPGAEVQLLRRSVWGDPLVVGVEGSRFALRRAEAQCVQIEALPA
ncbi:MAG: ferrous iron transport protein A [Methylibium sp.]|nr:ferrous iron transport protein A [Methylibium sp.]